MNQKARKQVKKEAQFAYRKDADYPAFVAWMEAPMIELPDNDYARTEPRMGAFEDVREEFLFMLWKAAIASKEKA